ncbi:MAG: lipid A biosynthesis acyltransferase [Bacteroidetes bacterium]|nr:MAG: lipid A biosynthesis acyltransferase [Bacteroidota bacterium]
MYYLIYGLLYLVSLLPWRVLYFIGDCLYVLIYYILGYRRKVVKQNLEIAFPEKSVEERKIIEKKFYHNFIDTFIEAIKLLSISDKNFAKRFKADVSILNQLYAEGKNVQLHGGHHFNWEMINYGISRIMQSPLVVVYMPIANDALERIFKKLRSRYGTILVSATHFRNDFKEKVDGKQYTLALVADQSPGDPNHAYWLPFFGKLAPFVTGPEKGAKYHNTAVVFGTFSKVKRGYYTAELELISTDPRSLPTGKLTRDFISYLEEKIRQKPDNYLWSHRRWKWEYKDEYAKNRIDQQ